MKTKGYKSETQQKNLAWFLPRPKPDHYKGGMPLYGEEWILDLAREILGNPEAKILNLFCGMNKQGIRLDVNQEVNPDYLSDAHNLSMFGDEEFDIVLADPPYSKEEAKELYDIKIPLNYKQWTREAFRVLKENGLLIVYHKYVMPNPNPKSFNVIKRVFIGTRTYHLPRVAIYFQKHSHNTSYRKSEKGD